MELIELFERVSELTHKYPQLSKEETKELMTLSRNLSVECSEALFDWNR